jgi:TorA maturation chaperone TorD
MSAQAQSTAEFDAEERARAHCYALLGRLLYGPPDGALQAGLADEAAEQSDSPLAAAWRQLQHACRTSDLDAVRAEYDDLFVSVGKAPVTLYTAAYAAPHAPDQHLLELRRSLGGWGLARRTDAGETEDHISGLCDMMRWLIESRAGVEAERRFFLQFMAPAAAPLCTAIRRAPQASFYRAVAGFLLAFCDVERAAFELGEAG